MLLERLIDGLNVTCADARHLEQRICDLTEDSRTALPGSLFVARIGTQSRGTDYIDDAIDAGASAILIDEAHVEEIGVPRHVALLSTPDLQETVAELAERFFGDPGEALHLIGVTGTNGKTTVAHLVHQIMNDSDHRCGLIGTVWIDDGFELARAQLTTPPAIELSHALSNMVESGCRAAVLEASSHALDQRRVGGIQFNAAIFTNISGDHLDYHKTMEHYIASKARLFRGLRPEDLAIVSVDDARFMAMLDGCPARVLTCSIDPARDADCQAIIEDRSLAGTTAAFIGPWGRIVTTLPLLGDHNVRNALQAAAAAFNAGVDADAIARRLRSARPVPGRLEAVRRDTPTPDPFTVLVDYAHTDHALETALSSLQPLRPTARSKIRLVFGCGGDRDATKRPRMMRVASRLADDIIVTNDNPRTESPTSIFRDILDGLPPEEADKVSIQPDRQRAIYDAVMRAAPGDIVLVAGKGHETEQLLPDPRGGFVSRPFDDRLVAHQALVTRFGERPDADSRIRAEGNDEAGDEHS